MKSYMILLIDREKAIMFLLQDGAVHDVQIYKDGHVPQRVRANERDFYGRSDKIFRHIENHLHRHMALMAAKAKEYASSHYPDGLVIGGHKEMFKKVLSHLPKNIQDLLLTTFVTELSCPFNEIVAKAEIAINKSTESRVSEIEMRTL